MFKIFRELWQEFYGRKTPPYQMIVWGLPVASLIALVTLSLLVCSVSYPSEASRQPLVIMDITSMANQSIGPQLTPVTSTSAVSPLAAFSVVEHPVKSGETLIGILKSYCRQNDYQEIARDNGVNPHLIYANKTILRFKNGCTTNVPMVSMKRYETPVVVHSSPTLASRASVSQRLTATRTDERPRSEVFHREITRVAELRQIGVSNLPPAQQTELRTLTATIRKAVLERYPLPNPDCLYVEAGKAGKTEREQILFRVRCIRENYGLVIGETARKNSLTASYIEAVIYVESGGRPDAISPTGCTGAEQFTQASAKGFGLRDRLDPFESIRAGGRHLVDNLRRWDGNVAKATAHFNIGGIAGTTSFNAQKFVYVRKVLRVQALIESSLSG